LNHLPGKYRAVLVLCYLKSRTHDQAAEELRCPVGTVRSRLARGRDLLKRRLTQRGHASTAAILGNGTSSPALFVTEAVPPSLVSATVHAAVGFSSFKTIPAGAVAASALALTQGVLTTMKLSQLKWVGLALLATSLSAGGIVAVSFAKAQVSQELTGAKLVVAEVGSSQESKNETPRPLSATEATEARLTALENKLDQLLSRSKPITTPAPSTTPNLDDPFRPPPASTRSDLDPRSSKETTNHSNRKLEAELKLALIEYDGYAKLFKSKSISTTEWELQRGKVLLLVAKMGDLVDDVADELELLTLEMKRKKAELDRAAAQNEVAKSELFFMRRMNEKHPGSVGDATIVNSEGKFKISSADLEIKKVEIAEVELRIHRLQMRRARIEEVIKLAARVTDSLDVRQPQPTPAGGVPPR
jgi:hypothetical protein